MSFRVGGFSVLAGFRVACRHCEKACCILAFSLSASLFFIACLIIADAHYIIFLLSFRCLLLSFISFHFTWYWYFHYFIIILFSLLLLILIISFIIIDWRMPPLFDARFAWYFHFRFSTRRHFIIFAFIFFWYFRQPFCHIIFSSLSLFSYVFISFSLFSFLSLHFSFFIVILCISLHLHYFIFLSASLSLAFFAASSIWWFSSIVAAITDFHFTIYWLLIDYWVSIASFHCQ